MNRSLFSLVLSLGAVSAGGTVLVPDCTTPKCAVVAKCDGRVRAVSTPCSTPAAIATPAVLAISPRTPVAIATRAPVAIATPVCALTVAAAPVACDPELLRARALARAGGDGQCSTKAKKKCQSPCQTTQREQEVAYQEALARSVEAAREFAQQSECSQKALRELAEHGKCSQEALRELANKDLYREQLAGHAHELAEAGEQMKQLHSEELAAAQADAYAALAGLGASHGDSIREKIRSALGKLERTHEESGDDDEDIDSDDGDYEEAVAESEADESQESSLEARIEALEELARERGQLDADDDGESKSLEERVASLERLMRRGTLGVHGLGTLPHMRLGKLKDLKELKDLPRMKLGENQVLIVPEGGWPLTVAPSTRIPYAPRMAKPKVKGKTWWWSGDDDDDSDDDVAAPEPPEPPEPPEAPEAEAPPQPAHRWFGAMAPGVNAEARREIESLMREMRSQIDSMRTEMERLREELVRASRRGVR